MNSYQTPYFLFEVETFKQNINQFREALQTHWSKVIIAYSIKTNYTPGICVLARDLGCYGEAVSTMELELVKKLDYSYGKSIFNGPLKSKDDLKLAIELGAIINLDSLQQITVFLALPDVLRKKATIGLRLNVDLGKDKIASGGKYPRFGITRDEISLAIQNLNEADIQIQSLHGHASSSDRQPDNYSYISSYLIKTAEIHSLVDVKYIDVGGGFYGRIPDVWDIPNAPSYQDYADAIFEPLLSSKLFKKIKPYLIIEPGMSVVANAMSYVTTIVSTKNILGKHITVVDGNYFDVRPTLHNKPLPFSVSPPKRKEDNTNKPQEYSVTGSTCMERDILLNDITVFQKLRVGDKIQIDNVGAYTTVLSPNFINYSCPIYSINERGDYSCLRKQQGFTEFFGLYELPSEKKQTTNN